MKNTASYIKLLVLLILLLLIGAMAALCIGRYSMNPLDVLNAISSRLGMQPSVDETMETVLYVIRIPRVFAAMMVGAMLSISGAVYQGVFRNPLVSPEFLGVTAGACVGAAWAILLGLGMLQRQLFAFLFGIGAVCLTMLIPRVMRNTSNLMLVLSGMIVRGFMDSVLGIMKFIAEGTVEMSTIVFWQMGSIASIKGSDVIAISPIFLIGVVLLLCLSWRINILSFGEVEARSLGINVPLLRGLLIAISSLLTASAVSISGTIGWIGLVMPHLGRMLAGSDHTKMLPVTALLGACFMLVVDTAARASTSLEIPLSILTGLLGAPFFAWLLFRQKTSVR
ncbi:iron ABC transporter permease [Christensenellaceae bacterium OttesenSCG-928-M15]|nr:iron ABC transporter permease [Christensenellaceae bacterium OttesenSCG-928-M15]